MASLQSTAVVLIAGLVYYFYIYRSLEKVVLNSKDGALEGFISNSRGGRSYYSFFNIPYAKPPVGELRFQPPVPVEKWVGVRDATVLPPLCTQMDNIWMKIFGQEDCLYLNVFTPKLPSQKSNGDKLLPVMVFIHGGYFTFGGTNMYHPEYFMDESVVIVVIQYRLGAFGFLSTGDEVVSGNMGMKDQVLALKYVQASIKDFGGDPNQVTIFGESAGSASVHMHLFSTMSTGLFHRAISQSGSSLCSWCNLEKDTKEQARKLGEKLKCPTSTSEELVACLRTKDPIEIVQTQERIYEPFFPPSAIYGPTAEKGNNAFLSSTTRKLYAENKVANNVPFMTGGNSHEGCWMAITSMERPEVREQFHKDWKEHAPNAFIYPPNEQISSKIRDYYFEKSTPFQDSDFNQMTNLYSDRLFLNCLGETARLHSNYALTYLYYFSHKNPKQSFGVISEASVGKIFPVWVHLAVVGLKRLIYQNFLGLEVRDYGVCHTDELQYLFYTGLPTSGIFKGSPEYEFSKSIVKTWVSFAKNGHPGKFNGVQWERAEPNKAPRYMNFGEPAEMIDEPFTTRMKFWESLKLTPK